MKMKMEKEQITLELATVRDILKELESRDLNFLFSQDGVASNIEDGSTTTTIYFSGNIFSALGLAGEVIDLVLTQLLTMNGDDDEDGEAQEEINNLCNTLQAIMLLMENIVGPTQIWDNDENSN